MVQEPLTTVTLLEPEVVDRILRGAADGSRSTSDNEWDLRRFIGTDESNLTCHVQLHADGRLVISDVYFNLNDLKDHSLAEKMCGRWMTDIMMALVREAKNRGLDEETKERVKALDESAPE